MAKFVSYCAPTNLEYARSIIPDDYSKDLFNDMGFVIRAKADSGEDIYIWMFMYRQLGPEVIINNEVCQTLLLNVSFDETQKKSMHDTAYINKGQNIDDYHPVGTLTFEDTPNSNTWSLAGRSFQSKSDPTTWHVKGEHAGVEVDLVYTQRSDAFYNGGSFEDLKTGQGHAAFILHCFVKGTIRVQGKEFVISNGHGIHERICMAGHVPERLQYMMGRGMNWMNGWGEKLSFYIKTADTGRSATIMIHVDGETLVTYGGDKAGVEEIGSWLDPKTNQVNPHKWRVWANTTKGRLDAIVTGYARGYYTWVRAGGSVLVHQFIADAEAKFVRTDGTVIEEKQVASNEYMRTLYAQPKA